METVDKSENNNIDDIKNNKIDWNVIDTYFKSFRYYMSKHHLDSYNYFVTNNIPYTIKKLNPFTTLKYDTLNPEQLKHEINVFMGGRNGDNIYIGKPFLYDNNDKTRLLYPNEARLKDLNYLAELTVDITVEYIYHTEIDDKNEKKKREIEYKNVKIGSIPIMLHSDICILNNQPHEFLKQAGECVFDQGGYFIINGKEKVLISQERITTNRIFVNKSNDDNYSLEAMIRCTSEENNLFPKTVKFGIFHEKYLNKCETLFKNKRSCRANAIVLTCPNIDVPVPIILMFRALGIESDKNILEYIVGDVNDKNNKILIEYLRYSIIDGNILYSQSETLEYLSHYVKYPSVDYVTYILTNDFLPNVGTDFKKKALFLGHLINKLIKTKLGFFEETNRDNYIYKRVDLSGVLLNNLFRDFYNELRNNIRKLIDNTYYYKSFAQQGDIAKIINNTNLKQIFNHEIIEKGLINSLKGQWGIEKDTEDAGMVQDLNRISYLGYVSHIRRVNTPIDRSIKLVEPHRLSTSQFGYMCPSESPDGANIGLLKHLASLCLISTESNKNIIEKKLIEMDVKLLQDIYPLEVQDTCKILINNNWFAISDKPDVIVKTLRLERSNGIINSDISIAWNIKENELNILTDSGRVIRPLYVVNNNKLLLDNYKITNETTWNDLLVSKNIEKESCIEYVGVEETNTKLIAMTRDKLKTKQPYTNCEIHPSTMLSLYTATVPFSHMNQAPRNAFSGAQVKQAIGLYATNYNSRIDTASYVLHYPQKPLIHTRYTKYSNNDNLPNAQNVIVAIMTYTGYNQEDSIIVNRASLQRGMFDITTFKSVVEEEDENQRSGEKIIFGNPIVFAKNGIDIERKIANWDTIDDNGFPRENTYIKENDVLVGKIKVNTTFKVDEGEDNIFDNKIRTEDYADKSTFGSKTKYGTVDKVFVYKKEDGLKKVKIRMRKTRQATLGDKLCSRMGQKGVIGFIYDQEDMPFTNDGLVPDIIINPHALPSRMTLGHLVESVLSKLCCLSGNTINATAFEPHNLDAYYNILTDKYGYQKYGNEVLYNGFNGAQIQSDIFFGPTYYNRLKHMVDDKVNSRASGGPVTGLTRQPVKGRSKDGGLSLGNMETSCLIAHGFGSFTKESFMERSDKRSTEINLDNGTLAFTHNLLNTIKSTNNEDSINFGKIETPYALKLLVQEIEALGISTKLLVEPIDEEDERINEGDYAYEGADDEDDEERVGAEKEE